MRGALVAAAYRWDEYPGLRPGRLAAGKGDLGRHPRGITHAVATEDEGSTLCGRPRAEFPHVFAPDVRLDDAEPCAACGLGAARPS